MNNSILAMGLSLAFVMLLMLVVPLFIPVTAMEKRVTIARIICFIIGVAIGWIFL